MDSGSSEGYFITEGVVLLSKCGVMFYLCDTEHFFIFLSIELKCHGIKRLKPIKEALTPFTPHYSQAGVTHILGSLAQRWPFFNV